MNIRDLVSIAGVIATIAVLAGVSLVFLRSSYSKARLQAMSDDIAAYKNRVDRLMSERDEEVRKREILENRMSAVESENSMLKEMVMQTVNIKHYGELVEIHHAAAEQWWVNLNAKLHDNSRKLDAVLEKVQGFGNGP